MTMLHMATSKDQNQDAEEKLLLLSKFTEKSSKFQKSSLTNKVYKANSDHFDKIYIKPNKKSKKSVLTLPNEPDELLQECTVSDFNDSEYYKKDDERKSWRNKCRLPVRYNKSTKQMMNKKDDQVALWKSPDYKGDEKKVSCKSSTHDVWSLLRNMNRFQFQSSPPMSDDSIVCVKKKKNIKKKRNTRIFETCRTEEIEYTITSYDLSPKNQSSVSIQIDQDTIINEKYSFEELNNNRHFNDTDIDHETFIDVNKIAQAAPKNKQVTNGNRPILIEFKNNHKDQGDVLVDYNQSTETLKNQKFSSNSTLIQSAGTTANSTVTSTKFFSNVVKPKETVLRTNNHKYNKAYEIKNNKLSLMDKRTALPKKDDSTKFNRNNLKRNLDKRSLPYKVDDFANNGGKFTCRSSILPLEVEGKRTNLASDNTKKIFDSFRGKLDPTSSVDFNKTNLARCYNKVNLNDVKRNLANMKFPIVITGRDQIRPVRVYNDNYCQFSGIDTQIWPFMIEWTNNKSLNCRGPKHKVLSNTASQISEKEVLKANKNKVLLGRCNQKSGDFVTKSEIQCPLKTEKIMSLKTENRFIPNSQGIALPNLDYRCKHKTDNIIPTLENDSTFADQTKSINFDILKNKMRRILQKKSTNTIGTITSISEQIENFGQEKDLRRPMTKIIIKPKRNQNALNVDSDNNLISNRKSNETVMRNDKSIENITKNKKNKYEKHMNKHIRAKAKWANDVIENVLKKLKNGIYYMQQSPNVSTVEKEHDVITPIIREDNVIPKSSKIFISNIPGFDEPLPALEVESLTMNEIAIKQCVTNLTIRFDVIIANSKLQKPTGALIECSPSGITGLPGTLKSQTTILNTVLPAELCSVIPQMMRKFAEANLKFSLPPALKMTKTEPQLATITELVSRSGFFPILRPVTMPAILQEMFNDTSSFKLQSPVNVNSKIWGGSFGDLALINEIFPLTRIRIPCKVDIPFTIHSNIHRHVPSVQFGEKYVSNAPSTENFINSCMTVSTVWKFDTVDTLKIFTQYKNTQQPTFTHNGAELMALAHKINDHICNKIIIRTPHLINQVIIPILCSPRYNVIHRRCCPSNVIAKEGTDERGINYYFLYKITNFEDFLQILGTGLANSNVFDEKAGKKIMSCVTKMKKWVDKIDIKQAMLIVLLAHKCDTQDMAKYGPKLLKSVAQNIVTNTSQLEKEIDAIRHRKLLNGDKKASAPKTEKGDLYQELYWIAKSAAIHSRGTFDENSEKKLKMFLEKRRQLNPSFLRAMATYLGLGLLTIDLERTKIN